MKTTVTFQGQCGHWTIKRGGEKSGGRAYLLPTRTDTLGSMLLALAIRGSASSVLIVIGLSSPGFGGACAELGVDCTIHSPSGPDVYVPLPPREPTPFEKALELGKQADRYADRGNWKAAERK